MNPRLIPKIIPAIVSGITRKQFQMAAGIASVSVAKDILKFLNSNNIGSVSTGGTISFFDSDRLRTAILGIQMGCDIEQISAEITWQDFEALGSEILTSMGYRTKKNMRLKKPTMEIDLVGISSRIVVAIDCKHWKHNNLGSISRYAKKQVERVNVLVSRESSIFASKVDGVVPAILTLHAERTKLVGGVPIIPVNQFRSFISELPAFLPELYTIK